MSNSNNNYLPFLLLFIQPIFMASNLIVARGGVEYVPPISLAFWRWTVVFLLLLPFTFSSLKKNFKFVKQEYKRIFFIGSMGCGLALIHNSEPTRLRRISNAVFCLKKKNNYPPAGYSLNAGCSQSFYRSLFLYRM